MDPRRGDGDQLPDAHNMMEDSDEGEVEATSMFADSAEEAAAPAGDWVEAAGEGTGSFMADEAPEAPPATPTAAPPPRRTVGGKDTGRVKRSQIDDLFDRAKKLRGD